MGMREKNLTDPVQLDEMAVQMCASPKYRALKIPVETAAQLLAAELPLHRSRKDAIKAARQKLHQVAALYLGEPDHAAMQLQLDAAFQSGEAHLLKEVCRSILESHASTRERLPILQDFFERLFAITGKPQIILDLACGLHPFSIPWMGLAPGTEYRAYDLNRPRVDFINHFLPRLGFLPLAEHGDILLHPPQVKADVAFFFKEAHRFEQRKRGCNREFWQALNVHFLLVSLPTSSLSGRHDLLEQQRRLVYATLEGQPWHVQELLFDNEIVFCVDKHGKAPA
jgi:16S rRNA (guanine(1405)-N(7))-methyltransferase